MGILLRNISKYSNALKGVALIVFLILVFGPKTAEGWAYLLVGFMAGGALFEYLNEKHGKSK